jgi:hypothetical protein
MARFLGDVAVPHPLGRGRQSLVNRLQLQAVGDRCLSQLLQTLGRAGLAE